jgi:hypothetical protein
VPEVAIALHASSALSAKLDEPFPTTVLFSPSCQALSSNHRDALLQKDFLLHRPVSQ